MGNVWDTIYDYNIGKPEGTPVGQCEPTFDPNLGFANGRKPRVMIATEEEMEAAKLQPSDRDYCAHVLLKALRCKRDNWPLVYKCHHVKEEFAECRYEDYVLRMKEYEREKRLLRRQQRVERAQA